jgi:hypothetical protein
VSFNPNRDVCPHCKTKLISIDLLDIKQLYCASCTQPDCHNGATGETFSAAFQKLKQNYDRTIEKLNLAIERDANEQRTGLE